MRDKWVPEIDPKRELESSGEQETSDFLASISLI